MASFSCSIGKGLKEPCSPNREDYLFGAALNDFDANGWNCLPTMWDGTSTYDLSSITWWHEVVLCLVKLSDADEGWVFFNFKWYNDDTEELLYEFNFDWGVDAGSWAYSYSYIGLVPWEINVNGNYKVVITVVGDNSHNETITFTVSNIPANLPPGYIWIEGTYFHYTDGSGIERRGQGTDTGSNGTSGHIWVNDENYGDGEGSLYYIDSSGNIRRLAAAQSESHDPFATPGHIWIEGTKIRWITPWTGGSTSENYYEGAAV